LPEGWRGGKPLIVGGGFFGFVGFGMCWGLRILGRLERTKEENEVMSVTGREKEREMKQHV
jgi:hypothetical protein